MKAKNHMATKQTDSIAHQSFKIGLVLKGADGVLEIITGVLMLFLNPLRMNRILTLLTKHELSEDPKDAVANALLSFASQFSVSTQHFGAIYLLSHGILKCVLMVLLWKKKLWAYPLTIAVLLLFIVYQLYRFAIEPSATLILLTVFDAAVILLTFLEYRRLQSQFS